MHNRWVLSQAEADPSSRSEFFSWLEPDVTGDSEAFCADLEGALEILGRRPGIGGRIKKLRGPTPEFWAALCELKLAALLVSVGIDTSLNAGTPDLWASTAEGRVAIELTAGYPTLRFAELQERLRLTWTRDERILLFCPDETTVFLRTQCDALLERLESVVYADLPEPSVKDDDRLSDGNYVRGNLVLGPDERQVPTADIVDPTQLEVFLSPAPAGVVVWRSGTRSAVRDPWPAIETAAHAKARKLPTREPAIVAYEVGRLHMTSNIWADWVRDGRLTIVPRLPPHIAGVLCYWQDARYMAPRKWLLVENSEYGLAREPIAIILDALGADHG